MRQRLARMGVMGLLVMNAGAGVAEDYAGHIMSAGDLAEIVGFGEMLEPIETLQVRHHGELVLAESFNGHALTAPHNMKSASKSVMSALVGIAIERGVLEGVDQPIAPLLADRLPDDPDPRLAGITIGNLLSMQAGLRRTSNEYYGAWIASRNWVEYALAQPFDDEPGGAMQYSTGSTHLLSAILTQETGRSTLELARDWLGAIPDFAITGWERDPQGIYLGGNNMGMTPQGLLAFGEIYRNCGVAPDGTEIVPADWIADSWVERTQSRFTGDGYGYGWFLRESHGEPVAYGWGYGGQMLFVVPSVDLTIAITSDDTGPSAGTGYLEQLSEILDGIVLVAQQHRDASGSDMGVPDCRTGE